MTEQRLIANQQMRVRQAERLLRQHYREVYKEVSTTVDEFLRRLPSLTLTEATKYNRLASLMKQIEKELGSTYSRRNRIILERTLNEYFESRNETNEYVKALTKNTYTSFGTINREAVLARIQNPLTQLATVRLNALTTNRLNSALIQGLIRGDSFQRITRTISSAISSSYSDAMRIARTEIARANSLAKDEVYTRALDRGINGVRVWKHVPSGMPRDSHLQANNQVRTDRGYFVSGRWVSGPHQFGNPKEDINCKCIELLKLDAELTA